ncbi:MAG: YfdX family protein [Methylomarinum sp.]|nr:YfdX family protein [Methylomarinum sp.]
MNIIKSFIFIFALALFLGSFSTTVSAAPPIEGINLVLGHVTEAIKAIDAGESNEAVREHVLASLRESKEILGTEMLEKNRLKASRSLKKARTALKKGDTQKAKNLLGEAEKKFADLKKFI